MRSATAWLSAVRAACTPESPSRRFSAAFSCSLRRVAHRKRSLTIAHLLQLQEATGQPLPLLLLEAITEDSVPESLAPLYEKAREVLAAGAEVKHSGRKRHKKTA